MQVAYAGSKSKTTDWCKSFGVTIYRERDRNWEEEKNKEQHDDCPFYQEVRRRE